MTEYVFLASVKRPGKSATYQSIHKTFDGAILALGEYCDVHPHDTNYQHERGGNQHRLSRWTYIHTRDGVQNNLVQRIEKYEVIE